MGLGWGEERQAQSTVLEGIPKHMDVVKVCYEATVQQPLESHAVSYAMPNCSRDDCKVISHIISTIYQSSKENSRVVKCSHCNSINCLSNN